MARNLIIDAGLIRCGWVTARAGYDALIFDPAPTSAAFMPTVKIIGPPYRPAAIPDAAIA
jgi:hypothetical protein